MKNQAECYKALLEGEILINSLDKTKAKLDPDGATVRTNAGDDFYVQYDGYFTFPAQRRVYRPPKWYENTPDGGVLCFCSDGSEAKIVRIILSNAESSVCSYHYWNKVTPLTKQEIQVFMDNAPMEDK